MLSNTDLRCYHNPLKVAFEKQEKIESLKEEINALSVEYFQILYFCKDGGIEEKEGYTLKTVRNERRVVNPVSFKEMFPKENKELVERELALMDTEMKSIRNTEILPKILIKDAEELIPKKGKINKACKILVNENTVVVKDDGGMNESFKNN